MTGVRNGLPLTQRLPHGAAFFWKSKLDRLLG